MTLQVIKFLLSITIYANGSATTTYQNDKLYTTYQDCMTEGKERFKNIKEEHKINCHPMNPKFWE